MLAVLDIAEGAGLRGGNRRLRYRTALGSAIELRGVLHTAEAQRYAEPTEQMYAMLSQIIGVLMKVTRRCGGGRRSSDRRPQRPSLTPTRPPTPKAGAAAKRSEPTTTDSAPAAVTDADPVNGSGPRLSASRFSILVFIDQRCGPRRPLASCSHAMQHARWEVHGEGRALISVRSLPREDAGAARLELASAWPRSMRLCLDGKAVFWARVWSDHHGWTWLPNEPMPRVLPSFDAAEMRARASREHPWLGWIERMAPFIEELCGTRRPIDLVTGPGTSRYRELQASVTPSRSFAGGDDPWSAMPLPSRPWPSSDDGRVKAYRKLLREGVAPPVLLVWISGLRTSLVLDGHARMVAASLEACPIPSLTIVEAREEVRNAAHPALETVLSPLFADPRAARQAMETLDAATRPSWRAISRAVTMDIDVWRREVRRRLRAIPRDRREALARELLAP